MTEQYFSANYANAKARFIQAAKAAGGETLTYGLRNTPDTDLTIDVAIIGAKDARKTLVITSGVHGVEGFFGSAVQLAWLNAVANGAQRAGVRTVLVHAVNPYGFQQLRRTNENNIDLNRNFPHTGNSYSGAPTGYNLHNRFLNPETPPAKIDFFKLQAAWKIWRYGMASLKESVASGQYRYPNGLFYGGASAAESTTIVTDNYHRWINGSNKVVHIDFHSGLGNYADYKLLISEGQNTEAYRTAVNIFGHQVVEVQNDSSGTAYPVSGMFGVWCQQQSTAFQYQFLGAEFGTYDVLRVLKALRVENQAHRFSTLGGADYQSAKQALLECFCPADSDWRQKVIRGGLDVLKKAGAAL